MREELIREAREAVESQARLAQAYIELDRQRDELLHVLKRARGAVYEVHGQGIGCPECPDQDIEDELCPLVKDFDAIIAKVEAYR